MERGAIAFSKLPLNVYKKNQPELVSSEIKEL